MLKTIVYRPPEPSDITHIAARMRRQDVAELAALGLEPAAALERSVRASVLCWTATVDGEPALITGAAPLATLLGDIGAPWLLGTDLVTQQQRAFMRLAPVYIDAMLSTFSHLLNFVHAENTASVRWLKRMQFQLHPAQPFGPKGAHFHPFERRRHV